MSDSGRPGLATTSLRSMGCLGCLGRAMTPCATRRSMAGMASMPVMRATGRPRSVTTSSSPSRTRVSQSLRCARRSVMATCMPVVYRLISIKMYTSKDGAGVLEGEDGGPVVAEVEEDLLGLLAVLGGAGGGDGGLVVLDGRGDQ